MRVRQFVCRGMRREIVCVCVRESERESERERERKREEERGRKRKRKRMRSTESPFSRMSAVSDGGKKVFDMKISPEKNLKKKAIF